MAQAQEPPTERADRLTALKAQIGPRGQKAAAPTPAPAATPPAQPEQSAEIEESEQQKSERKRHTLYYSMSLNTQVDNAFKRVAHDIFPLEIEKADFVEACFLYCLENLGDIQALLQHPPASS